MFRKVLVANRGEIAVRVMRTLREMGIASVAVYSEADRGALHVRYADEAYCIGPAPAAESYLLVDRIVETAQRSGAEGIHPGYGFLSENAALVEACDREGITFIGPPAAAMAEMGSKTRAREKMEAAGVPVTPGGSAATVEEALATAERVGYPILLKAAMGGGGKGMRLVNHPDELPSALERARGESQRAFNSDLVYIEKAILRPRHVEIQVLGDTQGNVVHLFERDCSIQRRHQKVVEETPCPAIDDAVVAKMGEVAVRGAKAVGYYSAGTFEFLLGADGEFYFLEMNTRLQVEHPITEWITGFDLVREMIRIAAGEPLGYAQSDITRRGAAIECRIYAEDPTNRFLPSPGIVQSLSTPSGPWVRDDSGVYEGAAVPSFYDPLVSKLSVWAPTRPEALLRMRRALSEYVVTGIRTNLVFHEKLLAHPRFAAGEYDTGFIDEFEDEVLGYTQVREDAQPELAAAIALAVHEAARHRGTSADDEGEELQSDRSAVLSPWVAAHRARAMRS